MTPNNIVPGGSGSDTRRQTCAPAYRSQGQGRPSKVRCRLARFYRAVDWAYLRFTLAAGATVFVAVDFAFERAL